MDPNPAPARPDQPASEPSPDRDAAPHLSSRWLGQAAKAAIPLGVLVSVATAAATLTMQQPLAPGGVLPSTATASPVATAPAYRGDPLWGAIDSWNRLRQSDRLPFADYATFLIAHRGWPGEMALRRTAERAIQPDATPPQFVAQYFAALPPVTGAGRTRLAEALQALGRPDEARVAAVAAWTGGALSADDEARLATRFAGQFTPTDQDQRMERLLWDRAAGSAMRQLGLVSPARRPLYSARLAFQTRAPDAAAQATAVGPLAERDAGYVVDRALWLRDTGQGAVARAFLAAPRTLDAPPFDAARYLEALLTVAKAAAADNQPSLAHAIAAQVDGAYAPGATSRDRPLAERDPYTSLAWLGGTSALKDGRPRDAEAMFGRYTAAAQTPGSQAKGDYWAGRAADKAGDQPAAQVHYAAAARQIDQFYGQLATERLGRAITLPADPPPVPVPPATRAAFDAREVVRAAWLLRAADRWQDQTQFVRQIAQDAKTDSDHVLADDLSRAIGRPDLAVMASRNARTSGARDPIRAGFPTIAVPPAMASHWTIVHALTRQESQFDREALSRVGARGLMQLMPATAREQAGKLGLPWEPARLTADPGYNVMLGSSFFDRMLTYYGGSYVLAVASYNAGPGNVNRFIRDNGDPRLPGVDVIDWIEAIPLSETRAYVQKVLENAVVYDLFNPARARTPERNRLTYYLGHTSAG